MTAPGSIVIVGAGQAGVRAARSLRREGYDDRLVLLGDEPDPPYERPPLSKGLLLGETEPDELGFHDPAWYDDHDIELRTATRAVALEPDGGAVRLADGARLAADAVLLATGGRPRRLPGVEPGGPIFELRTARDALRLRPELREGRHLAVVGGGFIGLEVAAAARARGCDVTVLEALPEPLAGVLGPQLGRWIAQLHRQHRVRVRTGVSVERLRPVPAGVHAELGDGQDLEADLAVVGIGIVPTTDLARRAGCAVDDGVVVDADGRTSLEGVFAAGDVARHPLPGRDRHVRVEHYDHADRHGTAVARRMLGVGPSYDPVHWFWSDQYDCNLQHTGRAGPPDEIVYRGDPGSRSFTAWLFAAGRLRAVFGVNRGRSVHLARRLLQAGVSPTREQITDEGTPLRDLAGR